MTSRVSVDGSYRAPLPDAVDVGSIEKDDSLVVTFWLTSRRTTLLSDADNMATQPIRSRQYLTREELNSIYGPDPAAVAAIRAFAAKHRFEMVDEIPESTLISLLIPSAMVNDLFGVDLRWYT